MLINEDLIKQQTMNWITGFVIKYNICPFAKKVVNKKTLNIEILQMHDTEDALQKVMSAFINLDKNLNIETTLLVFPFDLTCFFDYLDFVDLTEALLKEYNYEGVYQLATFHPDYYFADADENDVSNYTNRSPYPMLHILRESSLSKAIELYGNTEEIPEINKETMYRLGLSKIKQL